MADKTRHGKKAAGRLARFPAIVLRRSQSMPDNGVSQRVTALLHMHIQSRLVRTLSIEARDAGYAVNITGTITGVPLRSCMPLAHTERFCRNSED